MRTDKIVRSYVAKYKLPGPIANALVAAGYLAPKRIKAAADDELLAVKGISPLTLAEIRKKVG